MSKYELVLTSVLMTCLCSSAFGAGRQRHDPAPEVVRTAAGVTEIGTLDGTSYRIDVPTVWNRALVVYFHGYTERPASFRMGAILNEQMQPLFDRGYAVVQSAYSTAGWALEQGYPETEELRQYFVKQYGQPAQGKAAKSMRSFVVGASMGGALVVATLELNPKPYAGGLDLCGSVGPTDLAFQRRFAWRAAFDFFFPAVLPALVPSPADFEETAALRGKIEGLLRGNPTAAGALRELMGMHTDHDVASAMTYFTFVIADMQHRAGGNPFDNRNFLYTGTSSTSTATDNALNDGVRRYAADPRARAYLLQHFSPSGRLTRPMLALHTTYDPRIPGATLAVYGEEVVAAGYADNLVQQYVKRDGHCTFTPEEIGRSFDELVNWADSGQRPSAGVLPGTVRRFAGPLPDGGR